MMTEQEARAYAREVWEPRFSTYSNTALLRIANDQHYWLHKTTEWFHAEKRILAREVLHANLIRGV